MGSEMEGRLKAAFEEAKELEKGRLGSGGF